jgi:hypothetical protein
LGLWALLYVNPPWVTSIKMIHEGVIVPQLVMDSISGLILRHGANQRAYYNQGPLASDTELEVQGLWDQMEFLKNNPDQIVAYIAGYEDEPFPQPSHIPYTAYSMWCLVQTFGDQQLTETRKFLRSWNDPVLSAIADMKKE